MKILFIGCVESSKILLSELIKYEYEICGVITKKSSSANADFADLTPICQLYNITVCYVDNINEKNAIAFARQSNPDITYCFGWSQLLKEEMLKIPLKGTIGFHPAKLPQNKGRHPIIWALALGLKETGVSFFEMDLGADTGKIIAQEVLPIEDVDDAGTLYEKIMQIAKKQVIEFSEKIKNNIPCNLEIENKDGNNWRKRTQADGIIDWRMSAKAICNLIRGLTHPYVGAEYIYKQQVVKVWKAEEIENQGKWDNIEYGKVIKVNSQKDYFIKAYDNIVHVLDSSTVYLEEGEYL